ncbi:MAG: flagellar hook-associated protein FlgK [Clostridiales bacterium]|nr:flagellar hook-associated protein FlgK [Clostridiales bacterium]
MPLMGSLYIGTSGLQTSQNALNTTAHNMSNLDTVGYVRQQILLGNKTYNTISINASSVANQQVGLGVDYSAVRQVRDNFLDLTFRKESGRSAFYEVSYDAIEETETLLGEMEGATFSDSMDDLWSSIQELTKTPDDATIQGLFVQRASSFIESAQAVYQGLSDYQDNLNIQVKESVTSINKIANSIKTLNDNIRLIETGGTEHANDLRDSRNQLLDELSELGSISYVEDTEGNVIVKFEGEVLVSRDTVYEMGTEIDETTGFYTPFWPQNSTFTLSTDGNKIYDISNSKVFDLTQTISSHLDTDIGKLKAQVLARGDQRADFTDLLDADEYDTNISQSVVMNSQAEFDQLVHGVVTAINKVLADASDPGTGYLCNDDGTPIELFMRTTGATGAENVNNSETLYSSMNLVVNADLLQQPTKLGFVLADDSVDYTTAEALKATFEAESYSLNPNVTKKSNFLDYYSDLVSQVANTGSVFKSIQENQQLTVESTESARQEVIGVSSDEEMANMVKFQNAYNAASRYINAVSEMLQHIINTLAT